MSDQKIFLVDDEPAVARAISRLLRAEGYTVEVFGSGREFMDEYKPGMIGCLVMDFSMPEITGLDVQKWLANSSTPLPIIFITGHELREKALTQAAVDILMKPVTASALVQGIEKALARNRAFHKA
jgi:FixJ family two-component response regulator